MKYLKLFSLFFVTVIAVGTVLSMVLPVKQTVKRSVTINAPADRIYQQLIKLENFNKFSVWSQQDSSAKYTLTGTDGTVGAFTSWTGHPQISGEGKIEITALEPNKRITHKLSFTKPKKGDALSVFTLQEISRNATTLTWNFDMATPRPWNIFNLFYSMDKQMGKDFEEGLANMKTVIEKMAGTNPAKPYDVTPVNFPATAFATIRQQIKWSDIASFYARHLPLIYQETEKANISPGIPSGLFYEWDEKNQLTDMGAAVTVPAGTKIENNIIQVVNIPASKAVYVNYYGAYDKLREPYNSIRKYLADNNLKEKIPSIEQYITGPAKEKDSTKWLTRIVLLVE